MAAKPPSKPELEKRIADREATLEARINAYNGILDKRAEKYAAEIAPTWKKVEKDLVAGIKDIYDKYAKEDGTLDPAKFREVERLKLLKYQATQLKHAAEGQTPKLRNHLAFTYTDSYYYTAFQMQDVLPAVNIAAPLLTHAAVMGVINNPWLEDGNTYAERQLISNAFLGQKMKEAVLQATGRGWDINTTARRISAIAGEGYHNSVRLARTEINRAAGQASTHSFLQNADILDGKRWNATLDSKTAPRDAANDRKTYDLEYDTPEMPGRKGERIPNHANCRCKWTPILASLGSREGERIARDANGKRIYTNAKDYRAYAKEQGIDLDERLRNDDPKRYLRQGETLEGTNTLTQVAKAASVAATASAAASWVTPVNSLLASGVNTEVQAREVGDLVRQQIESQVTEKTKGLKFRISELSDECDALVEEMSATTKEYFRIRDLEADNEAELLAPINKRSKEIPGELEAKRKELFEVSGALKTVRADAAVKALSEIRPMGSTNTHTWAKGTQSKAKEAIERAQQFYPTDWLEHSHTFGPLEAKVIKRGFYRGYAPPRAAEFRVSGKTDARLLNVATHELGHRFEHIRPEIKRLEKEFYDRRTAGEGLAWLGKDIPGGGGYAKTEVSRFDNFLDPYMGKDYGNKETSYFEIFTMGAESVFTGSYKIDTDPEYYNFILGVLASK